jgi:2-furoyl-CoA dehydrogenase 2Fe-2S iron sulfur subunit
MNIAFEVNGRHVEVQAEPRTTLADCLRYDLRLTGTHVGCAHGVCGACTVMVDGDAVRSCLVLAVQLQDAKIITVEGISDDKALTPLQAAFRRHFALQCGFCTPGILMSLDALLRDRPDATEPDIREFLSGHLCRCTGYTTIVKAALAAARQRREEADYA